MASADENNQPEVLPRNSTIEQEATGDALSVSKASVLSHSFEPKLSAIIEENDAPVAKVSSASYPQGNRIDELARPKVMHLQETLEKLEKSTKNEMNERITKLKMRLRELRGSEKHIHSTETEQSSKKISGNSELIFNKVQSSLRKAAFQQLAKQIIDKMPELIVKMHYTSGQQITPEMKTLLDTLYATLIHYLGQPTNEHEERTFSYLCYGLAKFLEKIIENVPNNQQESERMAQDGKSGKGHFPLAVQLARKAYKERQ
uniref:Uncharacterized protein n=1 Tax=Anopheles funestus TaxID=62324 RepID=A0A4Y0BGT5_ANOFN